jgi:hypothetical protein
MNIYKKIIFYIVAGYMRNIRKTAAGYKKIEDKIFMMDTKK